MRKKRTSWRAVERLMRPYLCPVCKEKGLRHLGINIASRGRKLVFRCSNELCRQLFDQKGELLVVTYVKAGARA